MKKEEGKMDLFPDTKMLSADSEERTASQALISETFRVRQVRFQVKTYIRNEMTSGENINRFVLFCFDFVLF
jgi:hypothetical protein